jgi:hypothetical protein
VPGTFGPRWCASANDHSGLKEVSMKANLTGAVRDAASELRRIRLPRTRVNRFLVSYKYPDSMLPRCALPED